MLRKLSELMDLLILGPSTMAMSCASSPSEKRRSVPWWMWASVALAWLLLLQWWRRQMVEKQAPSERIEIPLPPEVELDVEKLTIPFPTEPVQPDDLKRIEGVGPKIASVLQATGIETFAQLAASDVARLRDILQAAGIRIADPETWPEQAALAVQEEWEALETLQGQLKGGRRV
jgi:predicted flap endonuclease-1-like 5' DNA nuclease